MAGYTRQSLAQILNGEIVSAPPLNAEFNQILATFNNSTGHKHDGTAAEGPPIDRIADLDQNNLIFVDTSANQINFYVESIAASVGQISIQDGAIVPFTDNDIDLGSSSFEFKDLYIDGTANIDSLVADTADINAGTIDNTIIGGSTPAAATFSSLTVSTGGSIDFTGSTVTISGGTITGITDLAVADGGTGASTASAARTNLGVAIGTDVQAYDAGLQSISGLTTTADQMIYTTASDTYAVATLTSAGRAILDDADASAQRTTLGLGTIATQDATSVSGTTSTFETVRAEGATPAIYIKDTGNGTNLKTWRTNVDSSGSYVISSMNDSDVLGQYAYFITRAGTTVDRHEWVINSGAKMDLTSTGLGINRFTPTAALDVNGTAKISGALTASTSVTTPLVTNAGTLALSATGANVIALATNGSEAARIDSSGNVGIGTSSPDGTLHVHTASAGTVTAAVSADDLVVENSAAGGISILTPDASSSQLYFGSPSDSSGANILWNYNADAFIVGSAKVGAHMQLRGGNGTEAMRILGSGNVLIGTTTEGASKLVVADDSIQINTAKTPASAAATGTTGEFAWDANYFYICTGTNTWRRVAHATW